jgi:hypothetical protein
MESRLMLTAALIALAAFAAMQWLAGRLLEGTDARA